MVAPYLHALSCSKCGAALSLTPGQQILTCQYCAQAHVFVPPPPPERPGTAYTPGERVAVEWGGHWWPATLLVAVGAHEWRVHFDGWDDQQYDVVVGPSRIRHISQATRRMPGFKPLLLVVIVLPVLVIGGSFALSQLRREAPPVVQAPAVQAPAAAVAGTYAAGDAVQIEWHGSWFPGRILEVAGGRYKITYDGYSASWDEWVESPRLRRP